MDSKYFTCDKVNVNPDYDYLFGNYIREYDISKCNINILKTRNRINDSLYKELFYSDRLYRQTYIGNMIKSDPSIYKDISEGIKTYRNLFFKENRINEEDILCIKNDAIFTINKEAKITKFDDIVLFVCKNTYTSFVKLKNMEIYYNSINDMIDIKGIQKDKSKFKNHEFLDLVKALIYLIEIGDTKRASDIISNYYNKFVNGCLLDDELGLCRNLDHNCFYIHKNYINNGFDIPIDKNPNNYINTNNILILMELNKIVNSIILKI